MPVPVLGQGLVLTYSADREPDAAVAGAHGLAVRTDVEFARVVRVAIPFERRGPVAADAACVVDVQVRAEAGGGQKEGVAVRAGELASVVDAVYGGPLHSGVIDEFLPLLYGGGAGSAAESRRGGIIHSLQGGQVVGEAIEAKLGIIAILGQCIGCIAVCIGAPVVDLLRLRLAPGVVVAILLGACGAEVALGPQEARGQPKVYPSGGSASATAVVAAITGSTAVVVFLLARGKGQPCHQGHQGRQSDCPFHGVVVLSMLSMLVIISSCFSFAKIRS